MSKNKVNILSILPLTVIIASIQPAILTDSFAHIAPIFCTLTAAYLYYSVKENKFAKFGIIILLASWIDNYNIVYFIMPLIIENILYYKKTGKIDNTAKYVVLGMGVYIIRHIALKNIGIFVPGAGEILDMTSTITKWSGIGNRFLQFYLNFSALFSANFWGLGLHKAIFILPFATAMCFALYLQCNYAVKIFKEKSFEENRFMIFLIAGSILIFGLQIFSQMPMATRYLSGAFVNSLVVLGYEINKKGA